MPGAAKELSRRPVVGASIAVLGVGLCFGLDLYYAQTSELAETTDDHSVSLGGNVYASVPFLVLGLVVCFTRARFSPALLSAGVLAINAALAYDFSWTTDSSTAGIALGLAPIYGLAATAVIFLLDAVVRDLRSSLGRNKRPV
jgi:hypothetical protein